MLQKSPPEPVHPLAHAEIVRWAIILIVGGIIAVAVWQLTALLILPPFITLLTVPTVEKWAIYLHSRAAAVAAMMAMILGITVATVLLVVLPLSVQLDHLAQRFPDLVQTWLPQAQKLVADIQERLSTYHVFDKNLDVALGGLVQLVSKTFTEGGGGALGQITGLLFAPLVMVLETALILVLVGFDLGYWSKSQSQARGLLALYLPAVLPWVEQIVREVQSVGRNVAWGYIVVVCILAPLNMAAFGVMMWFYDADLSVVNLMVISICLGIISAMPGLGTKVGLGAMVLIGLFVFGFSRDVAIAMAVIGLVLTTFESRVLTPHLMGKALGLNSCVIITLAIASLLMGGVGGTMWTMFFGVVVVVAVHRVYRRQTETV